MSPIEKNVSSPDATVELTPELKRLEKANNSLKIVKEMSLLGVSSGVKSVRNILLLVIVNCEVSTYFSVIASLIKNYFSYYLS